MRLKYLIERDDVKEMKKMDAIATMVAIVCNKDDIDLSACKQPSEEEIEKCDKICLELKRELSYMGVEGTVVSQEADWSNYKVLFIPMMHLRDGGIGKKVKEFVATGGTILATCFTGYENKEQSHEVDGILEEDLWNVFGIIREDTDIFDFSEYNGIIWSNGARVRTLVRDYAEILQVESAEVLASFEDDFYVGKAAITKNQFGKGYAYYVAGGIAAADLRVLFERMLSEAGIETSYL